MVDFKAMKKLAPYIKNPEDKYLHIIFDNKEKLSETEGLLFNNTLTQIGRDVAVPESPRPPRATFSEACCSRALAVSGL